MGMSIMMMPTLSGNRIARGCHCKLAMFDTTCAHQLVSKLFQQMPFPLNDQHLKTIMVVQMDVQHRLNIALKRVLQMCQCR